MQVSEIDPSNLIFESYRIEGIDAAECRSIFLDWALKLPGNSDQKQAINLLLATYAADAPDHPMSDVLQQALAPAGRTGRRGGRAGRVENS